MYRDEETKISYKYLKEVISNLDEPICLLGGWAVYFTVNALCPFLTFGNEDTFH